MILENIKETYIKKRGRNNFLKVLCLYPSPLSVGMCNLGYNFLLNSLSDGNIFFDRAFIPNEEYLPSTYDSNLSPDKFDIILISVSYEMDLLKIPYFIKKSGISLYSKDRKEKEPIIIVGGPVTLLNINIILPTIDLVCIGDGDISFPKLIEKISVSKKEKKSRDEIIRECEKIKNIFSNDLRSSLEIESGYFQQPSHSWAISPNYSFKNMFMVEISRGCVRNCPFCMVKGRMGCFKPFPKENILKKIEIGFLHTKYFGLTGAAAVYHPKIKEIMDFIIENGGKASFSSMYIERIDEEFMDKLKLLNQKTITFGVESINENLRKNIGKRFTNNDIIEKIGMISSYSIENVKFYIILGMDSFYSMQSEADELVEFIYFISKKFNRIRFTLSLNPFIPKPGTLWSKEKMAGKNYKKISNYIKRKLSRYVNVSSYSYREATICTYINRLEKSSNFILDSLSEKYPISLNETDKLFKKRVDDMLLNKINYEPGPVIKLI